MQDKQGHRRVACVSRCGVKLSLRVYDLSRGRPLSCEGCRDGMAAPPQARVEEQPTNWGDLMAVELLNPNVMGTRQKREDWVLAKGLLERLLADTTYGSGFGWKAYVRDAHMHRKSASDSAQLREVNLPERKAWVRLRPAGAEIWFDVWLSWVRVDHAAGLVVDELSKAIERAGRHHAADDQDDAHHQEIEPMPTNQTQTAVAFVGLPEKLTKVRSGLDRLIELSRDAQALEQLRQDAVKRHKDASDAVGGPAEKRNRLAARLAELADEVAALRSQEDELAVRLRATADARHKSESQHDVIRSELTAADAVFLPLKAAFDETEANLKEIEASERERAIVLSKAGDLSVILAALERIG